MILAVGEILADMIGDNKNENLTFKAFCGGAPFNVAVNAKNAGAKVAFLGRVGKDPIGKFLIAEASKANLDCLDIQTDTDRNTTLAFVTLKDGERDFAFHRHETADYNISLEDTDFNDIDDLSIVHVGSLMLSEESGRNCADLAIEKARNAGKIVSFDVNLRMDLYDTVEDAIKTYLPYVNYADIIKFSDDEIIAFTGKSNLEDAIECIYRKNSLLLITLGSKGSMYKFNSLTGTIPTEKVKPIDTTGAGDSFFGTFLANIENKDWNKENIENALASGNKAGARTTQFLGAVKI
jgi:sugar/nucleoside kinase (ribokinase family)